MQRNDINDAIPADRPPFRVGDGAVPRLYPAADLQDEHPGQRGRWVIPPSPGGWTGVVVGEWELTAAGWEDMHPNAETNYVVDGELHVESGGITVIACKGDVVQVPGGCVGKYWAPTYARMVAFHGPNPSGDATEINRPWKL